MKTKSLSVLLLSLMLAAYGSQREAQAQVSVSVYARIPLAPAVVLTGDVPVMAAPSTDYVWIDGYWTWNYYDRTYVWVQGYWALAPYAGACWIPGYWERYRGGYRWIDACWLPRNYRLLYGYCDGRFDYYGRPVYYHRPHTAHHHGYVYAYDHHPNHRAKGYNSSAHYNEMPRRERERIDRQHANARPASVNNRTERSRSSVTTHDRSNNRETMDLKTDKRTAPARRDNTQSAVSGNARNENGQSTNTNRSRNENRQSVRSESDRRKSSEVNRNGNNPSSSRSERAGASTRSSNNREAGSAGESGRSDRSGRK
ncbi:MAG: hypothetical protein LBH19_10450 [Dysgonamonadaceae bacterium]|jgi:hypothetical protein|nr:hypothetical protein [Dysgonamonadaceae bacterium]